ncbi:MAG: endonuclease III [Bacilli bacterium]
MMKMSKKVDKLLGYLDELYPNPICELKYNKDYELLIAVVLSAQTTDKRVNLVTPILFDKYKSLDELVKAKEEDIASIIRPIGTFNKKTVFIKEIARRLLEDSLGIVPNDRKFLESLPGVGRKTTNVVLSILYNEATIAVDTHVNRVSKRLGLASKAGSVLEVEKSLMKKLPKDEWSKVHHQLVFFGRYKCKSRNPECNNCKMQEECNYMKNFK